ncbi:pilus assembly protein TadG-related protein [Sphingomonas sp.]|uniref:pilus assembly protein TadG-related protein n=1 Tax=Sphingomonas sp. TaxID=28214 RepID=UPI0017B59B18|nr:pilus assembly protein TadG-related protein [Sphingomonas sp.]MBA3511796.1 pilus assembly protein [Sphingomonas sp.]
MKRFAHSLLRNSEGAVAPTIALSLVGLIAVGGIAFDYARMASMDTELQNAADQAALAAASQLDGQVGACSRAAAAARNMISNLTYMANDGASNAVVVAEEPACDAAGNVRFFQNITKTTAATSDENAKFVELDVNPRTAFYALTPVVGAFSSGALGAKAFAGLGEAICRVPPLMLCNPNESGDPDFTIANYVGKGLRLVANDGGGNYGPGLFGFLEVGQGNGAADLAKVLGRQGDPGNCAQGSGVEPNTGNMISVRDALNTRFDLLQNGLNQACGTNGDLCPPSLNSRKDLVRQGNGCGYQTGGNPGWKVATNAYPNLSSNTLPTRELNDAEILSVAPMGYPRDICHAFSIAGSCTGGRTGNGNWDRLAYFRSRSVDIAGILAEWPEAAGFTRAAYPAFETWMANTFGSSAPTRYDVYKYEMADAAARLKSQNSGGMVSHGQPVCNGPGITPGANQPDRRVLSVAVLNCTAQAVSASSANVPVTKWIDIFLTEPVAARTSRTENGDIYVEVIGETENSGNTFQVVKKAVPYLIE